MELDEKKLAFLGDSITYGVCLDDLKNSYFNRIIGSYRWSEIHNHSLKGSRIGYFIGQENLGTSFVDRYPQMPDNMDVVIVFGGTNDFGICNDPIGTPQDNTPHTFYGALNVLIKGLKNKNPGAYIIFLTPLHRRNENTPNQYTGALFIEYIQAIRDRARVHEIHLVDLYEAESLQPTEGYYETLIYHDGIHPTDACHKLIAEEVIKYLNAIS